MKFRQLIPGIIASLFIFSATELHQFLRIPELVRHYKQHCRQDASMRFGDFLQLHYTESHPDDTDEQEDRELPFKSTAGIYHLDQPWSPPLSLPEITFPAYSTIFVICFEQGLLHEMTKGIFHPPRIA